MFHVEQKELQTMIFGQQRSLNKIFFEIVAAFITYKGFFINEFNWVLLIKILVIFYCFGLVKAYKFDSNKTNKVIFNFLYFTSYQKTLIFFDIEYISVYTNSFGFGYNLNIYKEKRPIKIFASGFYEDALSKDKELNEI